MAKVKIEMDKRRLGIGISLSIETVRYLDEYCADTERSRSSVIEEIITKHLDEWVYYRSKMQEGTQNGNIKAEYGKQVMKELSKELRKTLGSGFSVSNLQYMRRFYLKYQKQQTLSVKLSWSHYCELLSIENDDERSFL